MADKVIVNSNNEIILNNGVGMGLENGIEVMEGDITFTSTSNLTFSISIPKEPKIFLIQNKSTSQKNIIYSATNNVVSKTYNTILWASSAYSPQYRLYTQSKNYNYENGIFSITTTSSEFAFYGNYHYVFIY